MTNSVKADIVIPTFNRRKSLEKALRALEEQDEFVARAFRRLMPERSGEARR